MKSPKHNITSATPSQFVIIKNILRLGLEHYCKQKSALHGVLYDTSLGQSLMTKESVIKVSFSTLLKQEYGIYIEDSRQFKRKTIHAKGTPMTPCNLARS